MRLEPLTAEHIAGLIEAASGPRDTFALTWVPTPDADSVGNYVHAALSAYNAGTALPFATVRLDGGPATVVGSTRFMNVERWVWPASRPRQPEIESRIGPEAVEIGSTWLGASAQRSAVNTEAKLLMLTYAFETWKCLRVSLRTDARNMRSRANIERVGATFEGVLRNHMWAYDDGIRDTATYSLVAADWPGAKERLAARLR